jgi:Sec-independent protein secretion pathway component TatC
MALPMIALYNLSIIVAWLVVRNKRKQPGYEAMPEDEKPDA